MTSHRFSRRSAMGTLLCGASVAVAASSFPARGLAATPPVASLSDGVLTLDFDGSMYSRVSRGKQALTPLSPSDALFMAGGEVVNRFLLLDQKSRAVSDAHGKGTCHTLRGVADNQVEKLLQVTFYERYPGLALFDIAYRNISKKPMALAGWSALSHNLLAHEAGAWTFAGASYPDRRDWVQPVIPAFDQRNFMGMSGTDYGGGTPVVSVWRPDAGLAVGHIEPTPKLVALPVSHQRDGTHLGVESDEAMLFKAGQTIALPRLFLTAHEGDYFRPLEAYRGLMADQGLAAPAIPESSYEPIWCAWGYERNFTTQQIYDTLPKAKSLGLDWAVLDDGWQTSEGDWKVDTTKFPRGGPDLKAFADTVKQADMRPRLWFAPLAVDPGTDLLRDHPEMLLLDENGNAENVSWWDAFTLCPAYEPVVEYHRQLVRTMIGEWGFDGIKFDGQHLNGVAPCHNPAHKHARPEESFEKLQDFWKVMYDEAISINPEAVIEICPCGDAFAFHNVPAMNHTPASDPESSWQIRHKGKTFKALMGPSAPYAGDHVELSDRGNDFASSYGVGGVISTKFTWPEDTDNPIEPLPPGGFVLTGKKEALWRQWIDLYRRNMPSKGDYHGQLYDIGFDKPEAHAIQTGRTMHYAFFADKWDGPLTLRGLGQGQYRLFDPISQKTLGTANAQANTLNASFEHSLIIEAMPLSGGEA